MPVGQLTTIGRREDSAESAAIEIGGILIAGVEQVNQRMIVVELTAMKETLEKREKDLESVIVEDCAVHVNKVIVYLLRVRTQKFIRVGVGTRKWGHGSTKGTKYKYSSI